ncbi:hypothetical protein N752_25100 [Desulforamulus aquiferis]|nr:DNA cytosine methyltransferase [Desulforamulus aquiferis]RYD02608.1 hypothetical protein N752_25100 [Desulforamulus aquiferis]
MLKYADIFCGCGGLSYGFYNNNNYNGLLAVDHWPIAGRVYKDNHPNTSFELKDLYNPEEVENVIDSLKYNCDVLLGGPPCQSFSTLGKRKDDDKRSSLVDIYMSICLNVRPKIVIMENVQGIVSKKHYTGEKYPDFIKKSLDKHFNIKTLFVNALEYGIPQTRTRWLLVAVNKEVDPNTNTLEKVIIGIEQRKSGKTMVLRDAIGDLPYIESGEGEEELVLNSKSSKRIIYNHRAMKHSNRLIERLSHVPVGGGLPNVPHELLTNHLRKMLNGEYGSGGHVKNIYGRLDWEKPCGTIVAGMDKITCGRFVHPMANRLLTPRECARIQSFPDDFKFSGSLVNQYYLIGNAVPPKISTVIAESISDVLK